MLEQIAVENFKCFKKQAIGMRPLTLLTGLNAMGKSTVMQTILLLRQSFAQSMLPGKGLLLNGNLVRLGTAQEILYRGADTDEISLALKSKGVDGCWRFAYKTESEDVLPVDVLPLLAGPSDCSKFSCLTGEAHYLSAERMGPRSLYEVSSYEVDQRHDMGSDGRYAVAYLDSVANRPVNESLVHKNAVDRSVRSHVIAWLGEITPGTQLRTQPYPEINRVTLGVAFESDRISTRFFSPPNVGFGLSYVLPVLVAILASPSGTTVMIENPEAHLHPRGQSALGRLMALAASGGLQIISETHSDHVLNGVRLAVKNRLISSSDVAVHYFARRSVGEQFEHYVDSPSLDADGRLDHWPAGFFDEWEKNLDELLM